MTDPTHRRRCRWRCNPYRCKSHRLGLPSFVSEFPGWSSLTTAAAVLSIAARAPDALVTILPARCYVADEWTLTVALHRALSERTFPVDSIVTLGMIGVDTDVDENYLLLGASMGGQPLKCRASRDGPWNGCPVPLSDRERSSPPTSISAVRARLPCCFPNTGRQ